ncbi:MAG: bifunctional phosphoribosylaminoimidazolecarboxamide formyltransferase/IMP cyclohydrolase, partial [Aestuariivirgaceae bacterium]|nr:bifunctional phosphoribosylaminoimidazolecarboxamide formyltransferase/IMP cyclohydrolase [Aestuariivirgaceae bacterium]
VHGGLLAIRGHAEHEAARVTHAIQNIDLLAVNLYPFEQARARLADYDESVENIDIGGPAMIRAAAKNHESVTVIVEPSDYTDVLAEMQTNRNATTFATRRKLAARAYARTAAYDAMISNWLLNEAGESLPPFRSFGGPLIAGLRYGENPHQTAGFYRSGEQRMGVATARQMQGKELSYNNINDTDAAFECVAEFGNAKPACVIVKHANPCGAAMGETLTQAYGSALACDPVSAFGGILAFNQKLDAATASEIVKLFTEVIIAPGADDEALAIIAAKKNLRLLLTDGLPDPQAPGFNVKTVAGGLLVQSRDNGAVTSADLRVVSKRAPDAREMEDLLFAFKLAKHVKSNAIVYAKNLASVGIGAGQMSRLDSSRIAARKSVDAAEALGLKEPLAKGSVVASDAFFPFADGLIAAAEAGATAIIQPGGSMRDDDVIAAADAAGLAMVFTGMRHFRH